MQSKFEFGYDTCFMIAVEKLKNDFAIFRHLGKKMENGTELDFFEKMFLKDVAQKLKLGKSKPRITQQGTGKFITKRSMMSFFKFYIRCDVVSEPPSKALEKEHYEILKHFAWFFYPELVLQGFNL